MTADQPGHGPDGAPEPGAPAGADAAGAADRQSAEVPFTDPVQASADPADGELPGDADAGSGAGGGTDGPDPVGAADPADDELAVTRMELAERTADLQRLQAEFVNYKRRVERDRELLAQNATFKVLSPVVDVLDTVDRAREHGELDSGLKSVADQLERAVGQQGLIRFGQPGDPFDPNLHEAISHMGADAEVEVTTVKMVAKAGYRIGDRVVRAAQVLVVDPE